MFLFTILKRSDDDLLKKTYLVQKGCPCRNDWVLQVQCDKQKCNVTLSDNKISEMSKIQYKKYIEMKVNALAFDELRNCSKSKVQNILISMKIDRQNFVDMQLYLRSNEISKKQKMQLLH